MNRDLIENFKVLQKYYQQQKDKGRVFAYGKAINALRSIDEEITDVKQLEKVRGIGPKIKQKVKEFLETKRITVVEEKKKEIENEVLSPKDSVLVTFKKVWGIGPVKAELLYTQGMRTIEDLRKNRQLLTKQQQIGLKYYDDLLKKIPYTQITVLYAIFLYVLNKKYGKGTYRLDIAGSYRRGAKESGDVDCLISSDQFTLYDVVETFKEHNIITDTLSIKNEKFMGIAHCPSGYGIHIRLDIEFVTDEQYATALLYFTGSKDWNIYMRNIAKNKGYLLNEHGLYNIKTGKRLEMYLESDIFNFLDIKYLEPKKR